MWENDPFSQLCHFLHGKSPPNGESLQIHKHWHDYNEQFFESMLRRKISIFFWYISYIEKAKIFADIVIYVILRTTLNKRLFEYAIV